MNTFMELAEKRFSVRQFTDQPIAEDVLAAILEAGRIAPTAKNTQPQRVFVLKSAEALELARKITPCTFSAPVVLLVAYDRTEAFRYPGEEELDSGAEDCAIVATHMMLEAAELGVGSCWVNRFTPAEAKAILNLPPELQPVLMLPLGYPAPEAAPSPRHSAKRPMGELVTVL